MESRSKVLGHPIHPILIVFPLGLLSTSVLVDIVRVMTANTSLAYVSFVMMVAGLIGGVAAAVFGLWDWIHIPSGTRAKTIGLWHGLLNIFVIVLFGYSAYLRAGQPNNVPDGPAFILALAGLVISGLSGWLGGELVDRLGVGVDHGANLNAPNSLSGRPASEGASHETPAQTSAR